MNQPIDKDTQESTAQSNLPYKNCLNCGAELHGLYCHNCGQHAVNMTPTIRGFFKEYIGNAYNWDSNFIHTIWTLISNPGLLTKQYISGKFVAQVHPLKLNMFLLFIFITLFVFFASDKKINDSLLNITNDESIRICLEFETLVTEGYVEKTKDSPRDTIKLVAPLFLTEVYPQLISNIKTIESTSVDSLSKWVAVVPHELTAENILTESYDGYYYVSDTENDLYTNLAIINSVWTYMVDLLTTYFPMLMLLTTPILSCSLGFVQRRSRLPRSHHFIFALHYTAFVEFLMISIYLIHLTIAPPMDILEAIMLIGTCTYLTIAYRKFYKTSTWFKSILKALFTSAIYIIVGLFIFFIIFIVSCFHVANMID